MSYDIKSSLAKVEKLKATMAEYGITLSNAKNLWRLKMIDPPETEFVGMFVAEGLTEGVGARITKVLGLNAERASKGYAGGADEPISFTTRIWADNAVKNVKSSVDAIKGFCKRDPKLKRAPVFKFTSGTEIAVKCFVSSVGGIVYDEPRDDGSIRGATFSITLEPIEELPTKEQGMSLAALVKTGLSIIGALSGKTTLGGIEIPGGSVHRKGRMVVVKQGQTFEEIARYEYGNAILGDILRRAFYANPLREIKTALETGDVIDLIDDSDISTISVTPQSPMLSDTAENRQRINEHLALRGGNRVIFV